MRSIRVTEKHGDLPKSQEFEKRIQELLPEVADALALDRSFRANLEGSVGALRADPAATRILQNPAPLDAVRSLIGPTQMFTAVVDRVRN